MMKNLANYISISRILMAIFLIPTETFSSVFYILYLCCGFSDMLDGYIARKSKSTSSIGAKIDSLADIIFITISMIKILPFLYLQKGIIIWIVIIAIIKICNAICAYKYYNELVFPHTIANKVTGLILFITPLLLVNNIFGIFEIIACGIATYAAIQEHYYIRTKEKTLSN